MRISDWSSDVCSSDLLEGAPKISVCRIGDHAAIALPPDEAVERTVADGLGGVFCRGEEPAELVRLERPDQSGGERRHRDGMGLQVLGLGQSDSPFAGVRLSGVEVLDLLPRRPSKNKALP